MAKMKQALFLAAAAALIMSGCADKNGGAGEKPETKENVSQGAADNSAGETTSDASDTDSAQQTNATTPTPNDYKAGELLSAAAETFGGDYTYELNVTYSDLPEAVSKLLQTRSGDSFYMSVKETSENGLAADTAYLRLGDAAYDIDNNIGAYNTADADITLSLVENVIDMKLDRTYTHIPQDTEGFQVEEYTYTGDTYITVYDFYFDEGGALKKYIVTYTVEGQDELVETAEITRLEAAAEEKYLSEDMLGGLVSFADMTEDERLSFCRELCGRYKISTDDMYKMNITTDDLKRISFDELSALVYTYATPEPPKPEKTKDSKSKKDTDNTDN